MASERTVADQRQSESRAKTHSANDLKTLDDAVAYLRQYARESPDKFALGCLGIGFILGWKLKPW